MTEIKEGMYWVKENVCVYVCKRERERAPVRVYVCVRERGEERERDSAMTSIVFSVLAKN